MPRDRIATGLKHILYLCAKKKNSPKKIRSRECATTLYHSVLNAVSTSCAVLTRSRGKCKTELLIDIRNDLPDMQYEKILRRVRDSNPRYVSVCCVSGAVLSVTQPTLLFKSHRLLRVDGFLMKKFVTLLITSTTFTSQTRMFYQKYV